MAISKIYIFLSHSEVMNHYTTVTNTHGDKTLVSHNLTHSTQFAHSKYYIVNDPIANSIEYGENSSIKYANK